MGNKKLTTEAKIFDAANSIFLLFGYHGTTIQQIATKADVNTAAIHYYFRSKERLYQNVVESIIDIFLRNRSQIISNSKRFEETRWFFFTELYNNKELFEKTLKELYPDVWDRNLNDIKDWIDNTNTQLPNP